MYGYDSTIYEESFTGIEMSFCPCCKWLSVWAHIFHHAVWNEPYFLFLFFSPLRFYASDFYRFI